MTDTYTNEELEIMKNIEDGAYVDVENMEEEKSKLQLAVINTDRKRKAINIRLFEKDIDKIKMKAYQEGIPYQTWLSSKIHQMVK